MSAIITLTTDFGRDSAYVAAMKGVILSINPAATIVDITHSVAPQNVAEGAFVLGEATRWFPAGSIHVAVVDPGVGSERMIVYVRVGEEQYVCPDNGVLSYLCRDQGPNAAYAVTNRSLFLPQVSHTFHGRDIMAPVAARLSLGLEPQQLGPRIEKLELFPWPRPERRTNAVVGRILYADSFGNLITNIGHSDMPDNLNLAAASIELSRPWVTGIVRTYSDGHPGARLALFSSSGLLELAIVQGNAAKESQIRLGDPVIVSW